MRLSKTQGKKLISGSTSLNRTEFPNPSLTTSQLSCTLHLSDAEKSHLYDSTHIWLSANRTPISCSGNMLMPVHIRWRSWRCFEGFIDENIAQTTEIKNQMLKMQFTFLIARTWTNVRLGMCFFLCMYLCGLFIKYLCGIHTHILHHLCSVKSISFNNQHQTRCLNGI